MSKEIKHSRLILKRSNISGLSATTTSSTDHTTLPTWNTTDIYVGELFLNTIDEKMWVRTESKIKEIPLIDSDSFSFNDVLITNPSDGQVLTFSSGVWVNKNPEFQGTGLTYSMISPLMFSAPTKSTILPTTPIITETIVTNLSDINDVALTNLQDFDILIRKDGKWLNINYADIPAKKYTLNQLEDVDIQKPENEQFLVFVNDKWINKTKLDKIESLSWDKAESKLIIDTDQGTFKLTIQGKPIHTIFEDIYLDNTYHTIIVDASTQNIQIFLPPAQNSYGDIFKIKVINYTYNTIIYPIESEFIFTNSLLTELIISEDSSEKEITLQCDGNSTWYSI